MKWKEKENAQKMSIKSIHKTIIYSIVYFLIILFSACKDDPTAEPYDELNVEAKLTEWRVGDFNLSFNNANASWTRSTDEFGILIFSGRQYPICTISIKNVSKIQPSS